MRVTLVLTALSAALALALVLVLAQPAAAQSPGEESPSELTAEAVDKLLRALDLLIGSIPQYEAPYVNEDGDIVIRRKHPERDLPTPEHKPSPDLDTTTT